MSKFYFTYGFDDQPFKGGWTEIEAEDFRMACTVFRAFHPDRYPGCLNCCDYYTEERFKQTCMAGPDGNLGAFCHERITVTREVLG